MYLFVVLNSLRFARPPRPGQRPESENHHVSLVFLRFFWPKTRFSKSRDPGGHSYQARAHETYSRPISWRKRSTNLSTIESFLTKNIFFFKKTSPGTLSKWKILKFRIYWWYGYLCTTKFDRLGDKRRSKTWKTTFLKQFFQFVPIRMASWQPGTLSKWKISKFCIGYT